ncbi:MAG: ABC transporter ATP-binding protein [Thermocaproicibacter melissae]|jgi:ATP-binding cassette, subfamily F, member 3|uniref:ABC-F family ATP-binding cassette domain-containing protein n=1 Tax=Thermocaproicibacter melissae TaxID=2966552 RepID=UPI003A0FE3D1
MALLSAGGICKSFGTEVILENISFEVREGDRIGLIGSNGCGKTTLLKILTDAMSPDSGELNVAGKTKLGYMEQHVCKNLERTSFDEVLTVFQPLMEMEAELEQISKLLLKKPENQDKLIERQAWLTDQYNLSGGLTFRSRTNSALKGLGFSEEQIHSPVGVLSGGQRAKLQLAKLLLSGANLLLLDEPTNHLDISSVEWLEDFLRSFEGSYIVISHDRYFLDRTTNRTFELKNHHLKTFKGNYSAYLKQREELDLALTRKYDRTQKEIQRINGIIEQQRRWNQERNYKTIASKRKVIERLEETLEKPEKENASLRFHFGIRRCSGNDVLSVKDLALSFGNVKLFQHANMEIHRGERVFLLGPNGCGKTSFLKVLLGVNHATEGSFRFGVGVDVGYYDQLQTGLRQDKTVIDEVWDYYPRMTETEVRSALAVFLFRGEDVFKPVSALSGGERARILLLRLMLSQNNFLLLDEPTNHLDISSCEALENALSDYEGTLLIVSHDRYLINRLADKIYYLSPDGTKLFNGGYDEYLEQISKQTVAEAEKPEKSERKNDYQRRKELEAIARREKAELRRIEKEIEEKENAISQLEQQLSEPDIACDYEKALEISNELAKLKEENESLFQRWSVLAQKYEQA